MGAGMAWPRQPVALQEQWQVLFGQLACNKHSVLCRDGLAATASGATAAVAGEEITDLQLMPGSRGLLAATGDCRILLFHPEVIPCAHHAIPHVAL